MSESHHTNPAPNQDERIMAALAHGSIILPLWGVIGPIIVWVTQKEKSAYLRFQALQAIAFHAVYFASMFAGMACYMCSFFGLLGSSYFGIALRDAGPASDIFGVRFFTPFLIFGALFVVMGLFIVYGIFAGVRNLQGHDFEYLVIGPRVRRYIESAE